MGRGRRSSRARTLQWMLAVVALTTAMVLASTAVATAAPASGGVEIKVLSNRADLVSDGDALVEIVRPAGTNPDSVRVELDGQDIVGDFALRPDGRFVGLVDGLDEGENHLTAAVHQKTARLTITDHPIGGPIFSGPHLRPWLCTTGANGLGAPVDAQCNAPTKVEFFYQPQGGGALQPYDPANPPGNVATTTTDEGETVPFIVRRERGTMDRGIYDVAVLFDPDEPWQPWEPQSGWNGKVVWPFGAAAGTVHSQGSPLSVLTAQRLGEGFMVATHSLNVHNSNLNTVVSAESVMMLKEHIIETYGPIRYVIGQGGSGASIQQQVIANDYPGLLDGLMPGPELPGHVDHRVRGDQLHPSQLVLRPERRAVAERGPFRGDGTPERPVVRRVADRVLRPDQPDRWLRSSARHPARPQHDVPPDPQPDRGPLHGPGLHGQHLGPP